jgi:hypothetical protein
MCFISMTYVLLMVCLLVIFFKLCNKLIELIKQFFCYANKRFSFYRENYL